MSWTTDDLLTSVRRTGYLPDASDLTSADLLAFGDEELATTFAEIIKTSREEYRVTFQDIPILAGQTRYRMPRRTMAGTVRGITVVDATGESPAQELPALEAWRHQGIHSSAQLFYVFEGDTLVLPIVPTSSGISLRVRYVERFSRLVSPTTCSLVDTFSTPNINTIFLVAAPPANIAVGTRIDVVSGQSPFSTVYRDLVIASYDAGYKSLGLTETITTDPAHATGFRSFFVCEYDTTCFPQLPQEFHGVLALAIVRRALEALGDPRVGLTESTLRRRLDHMVNIMESRNQDRKPRIVDRGGRLRGSHRG